MAEPRGLRYMAFPRFASWRFKLDTETVCVNGNGYPTPEAVEDRHEVAREEENLAIVEVELK